MRKPNDNLAIRSIKFRFVLRPHFPKAVNSITNLIILMNTLYFYKLNTHRFMSSRLYILNFGRTKNESKSVLQRCNSSMTTWCHAPLLRGQNHAWAWFWNSPNLAFLFGSQNYKWRLFFTYLSGVGYKDAFLCPLDYIKTHFNNVKLVKLFRRVGTKWIRRKITFHTESPMVNDKQEQWIRQNNCTLHIAHYTLHNHILSHFMLFTDVLWQLFVRHFSCSLVSVHVDYFWKWISLPIHLTISKDTHYTPRFKNENMTRKLKHADKQ